MAKKLHRGTPFGLSAFVALTAGAAVAEDLQWLNYIDEDRAIFIYGVPETDFVPLSFECSVGDPELQFNYWHEPENARDGMEVPVMLNAGGQSIELITIGSRWEMDDLFVIDGSLLLDDTLIKMLSAPGVLSIDLGDEIHEYPLDDARSALKPFVKACLGA